MKNLKIYLFFFAAIIIGISACNKEKDFGADEARDALNNASEELIAYVNEFKDSEALGATTNTGNLSSPFGYKSAFKKSELIKKNAIKMINPILKKFGKSIKSGTSDDFNMSEYAGTYEWDFDLNDWNYDQANPEDKIIIKFPANENDTTNTAVFTLHELLTQSFIEEDEWGTYEYSEITSIKLDLFVYGEKQIDLNETSNYGTNAELESLTFNLFFNPYQIDADLNLSTNTADYSIFVRKQETLIISSEADITVDENDDPELIKGYIQAASLKITADIDAANMIKELDENEMIEEDDAAIAAIVNKYSTVSVYTFPDEVKIGDIEIAFNSDDDIEVFVSYPDGTKEDAVPYFQRIIDAIDQVIKDLEYNSQLDDFPAK